MKSFSSLGKIGIIGSGRLGENIARMIVEKDKYALSASYRNIERKHQLTERFGKKIEMISNIEYIAANSNYVILSIKPTQIHDVCTTIKPFITSDTVVISTAAAIPLSKLHQWLPSTRRIIRCMPNIPCSIDQGVVTYHSLYPRAKRVMSSIFSPNTIMEVKNDDAMDASTIISGCGPAFFSWFAGCLKQVGSDSLSNDQLHTLVSKTMKGTSILLEHLTVGEVINDVASPKGATEAALFSLFDNGVDVQLQESLMVAAKRIRHLRKSLDE